MRPTLAGWIGDADASRYLEDFRVPQAALDRAHVRDRADDYYIALVGDLFERMREDAADAASWARLGNALAQVASGPADRLRQVGIDKTEATLFAAAAFYCGGFPASAYLTLKDTSPEAYASEAYRACFDLLGRPRKMTSGVGRRLFVALRNGEMTDVDAIGTTAAEQADRALRVGPDAWIPARLFEKLVQHLLLTNVRAALPNGWADFWTPFVGSLLNRRSWEFFPSQINAIQRGLLERNDTFSLQMPTGAGKTALSETLLYWHAKTTTSGLVIFPSVAILLVPLRSLASELRGSVVRRLNDLGISSRCAYGGTVPTGDEVRDLDDTRVIVSTPEALQGLLGASGSLFDRISLVICDEGHLLDATSRGVGLELLLTRFRAREGGAPRFVFLSAIVPNIEEINAWLGGKDDGVVRSDYRPALAEYAVLGPDGSGADTAVRLVMHPHEPEPIRYSVQGFLSRGDVTYPNPTTGRKRTYALSSIKAQAIAAGRKALPMGAVAVFAANKRGAQGAIGLAQELINQLQYPLGLPEPIAFANQDKIGPTVEYLALEYGECWIGTEMASKGAILHHGDIPQEAREVLESLVKNAGANMIVCTSTLAEGVNLPIRTLVLYSVERRQGSGRPEPMFVRDIKNLAGRAGRAGSTTKGLVICANPKQWHIVRRVAIEEKGEPVRGALRSLVVELRDFLADRNITLAEMDMERSPAHHTLIDGIDATLVELAAEEIGEDALVAMAVRIADQTFAAQQATPASKSLLQGVFALRARRVAGIREAGRIGWLRETGARLRMIGAVESTLLPMPVSWELFADPLDAKLVDALLEWAWEQADIQVAIREAHRAYDGEDVSVFKVPLFTAVKAWLQGARFLGIAKQAGQDVDDLLAVHSRVVSYALQTTIEQGVALLAKLLEGQQRTPSPAVMAFPEHLRFGVPTTQGRVLASAGLRHRSAAVELGNALQSRGEDKDVLFGAALAGLVEHETAWRKHLGDLVYDNTLEDLGLPPGGGDTEVPE